MVACWEEIRLLIKNCRFVAVSGGTKTVIYCSNYAGSYSRIFSRMGCEGSRFDRRYGIIQVSAIKGEKGLNIRRRSHPLGFVAAILRGATFWDPGPSSFGSKSLNGPGAYDRAPAPFAKNISRTTLRRKNRQLPCLGWMLGSKSLAWTMPIFHVLWARTEQKLPGCSMYIYICYM